MCAMCVTITEEGDNRWVVKRLIKPNSCPDTLKPCLKTVGIITRKDNFHKPKARAFVWIVV